MGCLKESSQIFGTRFPFWKLFPLWKVYDQGFLVMGFRKTELDYIYIIFVILSPLLLFSAFFSKTSAHISRTTYPFSSKPSLLESFLPTFQEIHSSSPELIWVMGYSNFGLCIAHLARNDPEIPFWAKTFKLFISPSNLSFHWHFCCCPGPITSLLFWKNTEKCEHSQKSWKNRLKLNVVGVVLENPYFCRKYHWPKHDGK